MLNRRAGAAAGATAGAAAGATAGKLIMPEICRRKADLRLRQLLRQVLLLLSQQRILAGFVCGLVPAHLELVAQGLHLAIGGNRPSDSLENLLLKRRLVALQARNLAVLVQDLLPQPGNLAVLVIAIVAGGHGGKVSESVPEAVPQAARRRHDNLSQDGYSVYDYTCFLFTTSLAPTLNNTRCEKTPMWFRDEEEAGGPPA